MSRTSQVWLMRLLTILALLAVVAVMAGVAWAGEAYWGFR